MSTSNTTKPTTMEELLASFEKKQLTLQTNQEVEGLVMAKTDKEIVLDLEIKSDGVLSTKDLTAEQFEAIKVGKMLKAFVRYPENDSGQVVLSLTKIVHQDRGGRDGRGNDKRNAIWNKVSQAKSQNTKLTGIITELNKGGLLVEVDGLRGFLPGSQMNVYKICSLIKKEEDLIGQTVGFNVIEVDQSNNKLIFSQKEQPSDELKKALTNYKQNQKVSGKVIGSFIFGVLVELAEGVYGVVFPQDLAWEKVEDPTSMFKVGQEVEANVFNVDETLGKVSLSIKATMKDPFSEIAEKFETDDVVSGIVSAVTAQGVSFTLKDNVSGASFQVEGFMPSNKMEAGVNYEVGQKLSLLVDNVDLQKRKVNVAPFLTSTTGLIYK